MSGLLPHSSKHKKLPSKMQRSKKMTVMHRQLNEYADGTKESTERTLEMFNTSDVSGNQWFHGVNPNTFADREEDHARNDTSYVIHKRTRIFEDSQGNRFVDEKAVRTDDAFATTGTDLIDHQSNSALADKRNSMLEHFSKNENPFESPAVQIPFQGRKKED